MAAYSARTLPELLEAVRIAEWQLRELLQIPKAHRLISLDEAQRRLFAVKDERDDRFPNWYPTAVALGYEK